MAYTYESIATTTTTGTVATVDISNIPNTYTDLILICNIINVSSNNGLYCRVNSNSSSLYSSTLLDGWSTSSAGSVSLVNANYSQIGFWQVGSTTQPYSAIINFNNYSNTNINKTFITKVGDAAAGEVTLSTSLWRSTAAISSITMSSYQNFTSNSFASGSTFTLYGIKAA